MHNSSYFILFYLDGELMKDSLDLADEDEVISAEEHLNLLPKSSSSIHHFELKPLKTPSPQMLAVQESDDEEVSVVFIYLRSLLVLI